VLPMLSEPRSRMTSRKQLRPAILGRLSAAYA
jgi:hypothetical protein